MAIRIHCAYAVKLVSMSVLWTYELTACVWAQGLQQQAFTDPLLNRECTRPVAWVGWAYPQHFMT